MGTVYGPTGLLMETSDTITREELYETMSPQAVIHFDIWYRDSGKTDTGVYHIDDVHSFLFKHLFKDK